MTKTIKIKILDGIKILLDGFIKFDFHQNIENLFKFF